MNFITEREFYLAVETIRTYKKQIDSAVQLAEEMKKNTKMPVAEWIKQNRNISVKLHNCLTGAYQQIPPFEFIEDINKSDFLRLRNVGLQTWKEFCDVTGRNFHGDIVKNK